MKTLYLDESGHHDLTKIDPNYPVFVLGGILVENRDIAAMEDRVKALKLDLFHTERIILHTADISRNQKGFERLKSDRAFRSLFFERVNCLMRDLRYQVIACAIKTDAHIAKYGANARDPYHFSLHVLLERMCYEMEGFGRGRIIAESRRPDLDAALKNAYDEALAFGTDFCTSHRLSSCIDGMECRKKSEDIAGLQLADLVCSPIGRFVIGKRTHADYEIIRSKFRGWPNRVNGRGLVLLPK